MVSYLLDYVGLYGTKTIFNINNNENIIAIFKNAFNENYDTNDKNLLFTSYLFEILSVLRIESSRYKNERSQSKAKAHFNNALRFIADHYCDKITIADVAINEKVERHYLDRIFKMYSDLSPQQHLLKFRMSKSSVLLRSTEISITEIASSVGYDDVLHFSKAFKAYFGESPSCFRLKFIQDNQ